MSIQSDLIEAQNMIKKAVIDRQSLSNLFSGLSPTTQKALRNAAIGALLGGTAGVGAGVLSPDRPVIGSGLLGALLGGTAGGAGTLGAEMLLGKSKLPIETKKPGAPIDRWMVDPAVSTLMSHPATAAGGGLGALWGVSRFPTFGSMAQAAAQADKLLGIKGAPADSASRMVSDAIARVRGAARPAKAKELGRALTSLHTVLKEKNLYGRGVRSPWNLAAIPVGLGIGYMIDRYLKGRNR